MISTVTPGDLNEMLYNGFMFALIWHICNICVVPRFFNTFVASSYTKCSPQQQNVWNIKMVTSVFSCLIVPLAFYCVYFDEAVRQDPIMGTSPWVRWTLQVATGFFIWDLHICVKYYADWGAPFLLHALFCLATYVMLSSYGYMIRLGLSALLYEVCVPFLNARWFVDAIFKIEQTSPPQRSTKPVIWHILNVVFVVLFIGVRICFGTFLTYNVVETSFTLPTLPFWFRIVSSTNIILSYLLNWVWTRTILRNIQKYSKTGLD